MCIVIPGLPLVIPNLIWNLSSMRNSNLNLYLFSAEMLNRVQHDDVVRETSPLAEALEATFIYHLTLIELTE